MTDTQGRTIGFVHIGVQVSDLERSVAWYRDVVGLEVTDRLVRDEPYLGVVTGYPGVVLAIALLREPRSEVSLELLEYRNVARATIDPSTANPGTGHVAFEVDDVDMIHSRACAAGTGSVNDPVTPTAGRWAGGRSVYLLDPDGYRVELVQLPPDDAGFRTSSSP